MANQLIPVACLLILFLVNLKRKRRLFCVSSIVLFYNLLAMAGAVHMYFEPRTGVSFSSFEAMAFFSLCYSLFCLPALFYRDGCLCEEGASAFTSEDGARLLLLSRLVAGFTFVSFCYFFVDSIPELKRFVTEGLSRKDYRDTVEMSHFASPVVAIFAVGGTLSFVSLYLGIVILCFMPAHRLLAMMALLGGLTYAVNMIKNAGRAGTFEALLFASSAVMVLWPRLKAESRARVVRLLRPLLLAVMIPFALITLTRFGSGGEERGVFYSIESYFATGPYSFNADYVARTELGTPSVDGFITCSFIPLSLDRVLGTTLYEEGQENLEDYSEGLPEYLEICGAYSGEFKTIVGSFLLDWRPGVVMSVFIALSLFFSWLFSRNSGTLSFTVLASVYFYCLLIGSIGFGFPSRYRNLILVNLLILAFVLRCIGRTGHVQPAEQTGRG